MPKAWTREDVLKWIDFQPGCWEWRGPKASTGYGQIGSRNRKRYAHRLAWEMLVGPIPDGTEIDHLCRNQMCVNPMHLEPVPHRENVRRGMSPSGMNARKATCLRGHPYDEANTYYRPDGKGRFCRVCAKQQRQGKAVA
jgi:hypothetical protein